MQFQVEPKSDLAVVFEPDVLSADSMSSGTCSYQSLKEPKPRCRASKKQIEPVQYFQRTEIEDGVQLTPNLIEPYVLDETALQVIAADPKPKKQQKKTMRMKKEYRSQEYKRTAYRIMDEFFDNPTPGQVFRMSGDTKQGRLTVQMCHVDQVRQDGCLDEELLEEVMATEKTIDEEAVRRQRHDILQKKK